MMIGGGGNFCNRADHGIGITEADQARFGDAEHCGTTEFGESCSGATGYSLNLWIK